jgi:phosphoglycolate phosphatase-like HAD superfamily hydrolase
VRRSAIGKASVVTFDVDQTLVDFEAAMEKALDTALAELHQRLPAAAGLSRADLQATRDQVAGELGPTVRMEEIRQAAFQRMLDQLGAPDLAFANELTALYLDTRFREMRLYDDVHPTLALRDAYKLGSDAARAFSTKPRLTTGESVGLAAERGRPRYYPARPISSGAT